MEIDCESLKENLNTMRSKLKSIDESLKKLTGNNEPQNYTKSNPKLGKRAYASNKGAGHEDAAPEKWAAGETRKRTLVSVVNPKAAGYYQRQRTADEAEDDVDHDGDEDADGRALLNGKQLISRVIATHKEPPKREEILRVQNDDANLKARNRRMFHSLLGTLQQFRREETKMKFKEDKRAQVERKLEEQAIKEKEQLRKEKNDLYNNRKLYKSQISALEKQIERVAEFTEWQHHQNQLKGFIQTKSRPKIFYVPKVFNEKTAKLLQDRQRLVEELVSKKKAELNADNDILGCGKNDSKSTDEGTDGRDQRAKSAEDVSLDYVTNTINDAYDPITEAENFDAMAEDHMSKVLKDESSFVISSENGDQTLVENKVTAEMAAEPVAEDEVEPLADAAPSSTDDKPAIDGVKQENGDEKNDENQNPDESFNVKPVLPIETADDV